MKYRQKALFETSHSHIGFYDYDKPVCVFERNEFSSENLERVMELGKTVRMKMESIMMEVLNND